MKEKTFTPEAIAIASLIRPDLPQSRQIRKENADTVEIKVTTLSPGDQQLAALPDELAEILFAKLAEKGISAL
ncbi:MAG: hypothetical protein NTY75_01945 [Candidatus Shapirobacteria bacterium]|nr:hypothetical protein [Candidatus Shapirobacteria bacterium]